MKILFKDFKHNTIKVQVTNIDDLWFLSHIVDKGDIVKSRTLRKIKIDAGNERKTQIIKKPCVLTLGIEKIDFSKYPSCLRLSGRVIEGPEDIPKGSFHTFEIEENSVITIEKERFLSYQIEKLEEASKEKVSKILILVMDRESALFALVKRSGYEILMNLEGDVQKKGVERKIEKEFYSEIIKILKEYMERFEAEHIILASPIFWKEYLFDEIKSKYAEIKNKIVLATCSSVGEEAINEILKRDEVKQVLKQDRVFRETALVEELFKEISRDNLAVYGIKEVEETAGSGAVKILLVSDEMIKNYRENEKYDILDKIMKNVDSMKGEVHIISTEHDAGRRLKGLGGIGAILRYKLK